MRRMSKRNIGNVSVINPRCKINKRGQWQNYLLPAILAVLVLGISFYFIFNEFFTGEDIDREVCKESIMVRAAMPEVTFAGFTPASLKDDFPLKCKTNVIEVTKDDVVADKDGKRGIDKIIGDALAECWFIFGSGDGQVFAADKLGKTTTCIPCARIHLTEDAKDAVVGGKIDIESLLNGEKLNDKFFYLNYLRGVGKLFDPFDPAFNNPFNLSGEKFEIGKFDSKDSVKKVRDGSEINMGGKFAKVTLPKYLNVSEGDLIIVLGQVADSGSDSVANYISYMFYFQNGQDDYPEQMKNGFFGGGVPNQKICNAWEGIPA